MTEPLVRRHESSRLGVTPPDDAITWYETVDQPVYGQHPTLGGPKLDMGGWVVHVTYPRSSSSGYHDPGFLTVQPARDGKLEPHVDWTYIDDSWGYVYYLYLFALGSNATTQWVALIGHSYDDYATDTRFAVPYQVEVFAVDRTTGAITSHSGPHVMMPPPVGQSQPYPADEYYSFSFQPKGYFHDGVATCVVARNYENYADDTAGSGTKSSTMSMGVVTFDFDTEEGVVSNVIDHGFTLLGYWNGWDSWNYPIITSGMSLLHNGHYAVPVTSGVFAYRTRASDGVWYDGRTNCWVAVVDPTSGVAHVAEVHPTDPSYWGAMSTFPVEDGFLVSAAINYYQNGPNEGVTGWPPLEEQEEYTDGDWIVQHWTYDGSAPVKVEEVPFENANYWDYGINQEYFVGGVAGGAAHVTQMFGGSRSGALVTIKGSYFQRWFDWSLEGGLSVTENRVVDPWPPEWDGQERFLYGQIEFEHGHQLTGGWHLSASRWYLPDDIRPDDAPNYAAPIAAEPIRYVGESTLREAATRRVTSPPPPRGGSVADPLTM